MNAMKVLSLLIFLAGITLIVIGGIYTPPTEVVNLPSGGFRGVGFKIYSGESISFELQSVETFTVYIMNESTFNKLMHNGTFNESLYTSTGKYMHLRFTAPSTDYYYIVIANFNSMSPIEVDFSYRKNISIPLFLGGTLIILISILLLIYDWKIEQRAITLDKKCPNCNRDVSSEWNYCPYCREELRGDKR